MKFPVIVLFGVVPSTACVHAPRPAREVPWETAPLAPRLQFVESIAPGDVSLLVLDGHSGAPLRDAVANVESTSIVAYGDSLGRIRFHHLAPGLLRLRIRRVNYVMRRDSLTLPPGSGLALVVQMQRGPALERVGGPSLHKPPNER